jgi:hypothetical protein
MFFEMVICVWILAKFDQNPTNYAKKITQAAAVGNVQNGVDQFY